MNTCRSPDGKCVAVYLQPLVISTRETMIHLYIFFILNPLTNSTKTEKQITYIHKLRIEMVDESITLV